MALPTTAGSWAGDDRLQAPSRLILRLQMTYSLTRFAIYETARDRLGQGTHGPPPFYQKVLLGAVGGEQGRNPLIPELPQIEEPLDPSSSFFGCRLHRWIRGDPSRHGECQVSSAHLLVRKAHD